MSEAATIVVAYDLSDPPEKVWRALTEPEILARWLMPNDIKAEVGHRFNFRTQPIGDWDGVVECEVLECDPPRRLSYSWRGGSRDLAKYGQYLDTVATWTLTPTASGGTSLRLEHSGFAPDSFAYQAMGQGWRGKIAERITQVLAQAA
jgi:uncharacterized protein YndB with AHSA1/START domain